MIKTVPDTSGQERQITSVWLGFKASLLMTHLTLHDYRRDDSAAGSELVLSVSGIGWLTTRLHKLRADTGEVRLSLASRKSAAALQAGKKPAFEMAGLLSVLLPRWYLAYNRLLMTIGALEKSRLEITIGLPLGLAVVGRLNSLVWEAQHNLLCGIVCWVANHTAAITPV